MVNFLLVYKDLEQYLWMVLSQYKSVCKSAYFELHNINSVRRSLTKEAAATAIHASRLDVCNSLLYDLSQVTFSQVQ